MKRFWLYFFIGGFASGIAFRSFFDLGLAFVGFLLLLGCAFALLSRREGNVATLLIALALLGGSLGALRFDIADEPRHLPTLEAALGAQTAIEGVIVDEPDVRERSTRLVVEVEEESRATRVLVRTGLHPRFSYGELVRARGTLVRPEGFETETGRYFDYPSYLSKDGIYYALDFAEVEVLDTGYGNPVRAILFSFKEVFLAGLGRVLPEPHASLAGGLIVGAKESLGSELLDSFRATGIIHIVVLSGYNVTIVAEAIMRLGSFLPLYAGASLGAVSIALFALLTGASATIVRASIMALLVLLARVTGRTYHMVYALFFAGFLMLVENPKILIFDPSFQLSFLATLGLIWLAPKLETYFKLVPTRFQLREFAVATVATQLFVLPLLIYMTGETSLVALPVNLLVLVTVPLAMLFGFLAGITALLSAVIAMPLAFVAYLLLSYELEVVELFSSVPFAAVSIGLVPFALVVFAYALYGVALWLLRERKTPAGSRPAGE